MQRYYSKAQASGLDAWRRRHGLTVRAAAVKLGISERTMSRLLSGRQDIR
jgi:transcriptional regulator with XRE-family HTH domain